MYALNPKFYRIFNQNFGNYNEQMLRTRFEEKDSPQVPIIDCSKKMIKKEPS